MKSTLRHLMFAMLTCMVAVLVGCASIGQPTPQTFNERLLTGYATVTETRATATQLLVAGKISVDDAKNVQSTADTARGGLDVARSLVGTDLGAANTKLVAVTTVLTSLQAYLSQKRGSP